MIEVNEETTTTYYLRSSILGGKTVSEINVEGEKSKGYIYANGALIAEQVACTGCNPAFYIKWHEVNPLTGGRAEVLHDGNKTIVETDPMGARIGTEDPLLYYTEPILNDIVPSGAPLYLEYPGSNPFDPNGGCELDGMRVDCAYRDRLIDRGVVGGQVYLNGLPTNQIIPLTRTLLGYYGTLVTEFKVPSTPEEPVIGGYERWEEQMFFPNLPSTYGDILRAHQSRIEPRRPPLAPGPSVNSSPKPVESGRDWDLCALFGNPDQNAARRIFRGVENAIGQDFLADSLKVEGSFLGGSLAIHHTRDGQIIVAPGGFLDPKGFFVDLPSNVFKGTKLRPSVSITGQKILYLGNINDPDVRTEVFLKESVSFSGGYKLFGGVDISDPTSRSGERNYVVNAGVGIGINPGGMSYGFKFMNTCTRW